MLFIREKAIPTDLIEPDFAEKIFFLKEKSK